MSENIIAATEETATEAKARRQRTPPTEFGRSLRSFVGSVDPVDLVSSVATRMSETDHAKVGREITRMVSKANAGEGAVPESFKELVFAVIDSVVELDPDQAVKGERLKGGFSFHAIVRSNNWISDLMEGRERKLVKRKAFNGPGVYKLIFVRELTEEEAVLVKTEEEKEEAEEVAAE